MKYLVTFFLMTSPVLAFTPETLEQQISDFSGGLNTHDPSFRVQPGFSPYMRNVFVDDGRLSGINGYTLLGTTPTLNKVTGIFPFRRDDGQTTFLVTDSSVTLETANFINFTRVSTGSNAGTLLLWIQVREKMWGSNGVDFVKTWDGTTLKTLGLEANTPNVPKFKIGAYYQERVFGFNNPSGASDLDWSDVASTDGVRLEPDDSRAWPATNNLKIGQGDGQIGTALWIQDGQLRIGKERSIYTLYGSNSSAYQARKEENIGDGVSSQESVVQQDGHTYWLGQYGIYEDGVRISDLIETEVESVNRNSVFILQNLWETRADFDKGFSSGTIGILGTTITASGLVTIPTASYVVIATTAGSPSGNRNLAAVSATYYGQVQFDISNQVSTSAIVYVTKIVVPQSHTSSIGAPVIRGIVYNPFTGTTSSATATCFADQPLTIDFTNQSPIFFGSHITASSFTITFEYTSILVDDCNLFPTSSTAAITFTPSTTGQYVSDIATNASITAWGTFNAVDETNGGSISYYERTSTSLVNITTQTWTPISPGAVMADPVQNRFVQWAATLTGVVPGFSPFIDAVSIDHIEGIGSTNRAFGISWKNRYWLVTSTTSSELNSFILVKTKYTNKIPNAWMPIDGINIRSFAKEQDVFYAGASTMGAFYRLDFGTNFNGTPINRIYDTPDMTLGSNYFTKNILKYKIDGLKNDGFDLSLGSSIDMANYSYKTISFDGSGRQRFIVKGVTNPAKTLRIRLTNDELDKTFEFYDISVTYSTTQNEENPQ